MFVTLIDEKAGTEKSGILVEMSHDDTRGTVFILDPVTKEWFFEPRVPFGPDNAYIDDDGKRGYYFREGDPSTFPQPEDPTDIDGPEPGDPDDEDTENTETTW